MQSIPEIIFLAAVLIYLIGAFIIIYHLIRFGVGNAPKALALFFFAGSIVLVLFALVFFFNIF